MLTYYVTVFLLADYLYLAPVLSLFFNRMGGGGAGGKAAQNLFSK